MRIDLFLLTQSPTVFVSALRLWEKANNSFF